MEKHHLDGQPEEARFYIPEGADNKEVHYDSEGEMPLTEAQEKIEQRRKKRQRREEGRRRRKRLQVIWAVAGVFGLWLLLRFLPVPFGSVVIEGNGTMPDEDVLRVAGVPSYVNVVQLSTSTMRERLVRDLRVGEVTVERQFPATIHVFIKERRAEAVVMTLYGFAYIDDTGTVIAVEPKIKGVSVPIITGKKMDTLLLGDKLDDNTMKNALAYLKALSPSVASSIAEINVGNPKELIAYTTDGLSIHLGDGDRVSERASVTEELLNEIAKKQLSIQYIDVNPDAPIVKEK